VRGITLGKGDEVISLAILKHLDATPEERATYLKDAAAQRRALNGEAEDTAEAPVNGDGEETGGEVELGAKRLEMQLAEQFILTVSEKGYGKRSSSFEYRVTGRGGKGIVAMVVNDRNGKLIASFPVDDRDQIMLVTDGGQVIRVPVDAGPGNRIRIAGRSTQGVTVFNTDASEKVVSVERIGDEGESEDGEAEAGPAPESPTEA
jgi:DNA gyrase subunit A